jgi:hypothetical protein
VFICWERLCDNVSYTYGGRQKTLDQTRCCRCFTDSLLAYSLKIPPAYKTVHRTVRLVLVQVLEVTWIL